MIDTLQKYFYQSIHIHRPATTEGRSSPHLTIKSPKKLLHEDYKQYCKEKGVDHVKSSAFYNLLNSPLFRQQHALSCLCAQCFDGHEAFESLSSICEIIDGISLELSK